MAISYNKRCSGIYKIINLINNKFYIGSSIDLKKRLTHHKSKLNNNTHDNRYLQASYNKYGKDNFTTEILEEYVIDLISREQYYIDTLKPQYNLLPIAYRTEGIKRTEETKLKLSLSHLGKKKSKESVEKMRLSKTGKYYNNGKRIKNIYMLDLNNNILREFVSILQASRETNIHRSSISNCINNRTKTAGGFMWRIKND